jgi:hypothetical protein
VTTMTETNDVLTDKATAQATILKRSVCLRLECSFIGNSRQVPLNEIELTMPKTKAQPLAAAVVQELAGGEPAAPESETKADKDELRMSKQLLDRRDLTQVAGVLQAAKNYLRSVATQGHRVFGAGTYLVPLTAVLDVEDRLKQFQADLAVAVDALVEKYPEMIEKRKAKLGPLFDAKDYLSPLELRAEFGLDWNYVSFAAPEQLEAVDRAVVEAVQAKKEGQLADAYEEVVAQLREQALTVMQELAERLRPGADGKPKALRGTALRDLQDFQAMLPKRNYHEDAKLEAAVKKVVDYAEGIDVNALRSIPSLRQGLQEVTAQVVAELGELVETTRRRGISFGNF